jgi:hypothetical protein
MPPFEHTDWRCGGAMGLLSSLSLAVAAGQPLCGLSSSWDRLHVSTNRRAIDQNVAWG